MIWIDLARESRGIYRHSCYIEKRACSCFGSGFRKCIVRLGTPDQALDCDCLEDLAEVEVGGRYYPVGFSLYVAKEA